MEPTALILQSYVREDQALLEEMALVPLGKGSHPFPVVLAELFQLMRSDLLSGPMEKIPTAR